jgi:hypothetical protein
LRWLRVWRLLAYGLLLAYGIGGAFIALIPVSIASHGFTPWGASGNAAIWVLGFVPLALVAAGFVRLVRGRSIDRSILWPLTLLWLSLSFNRFVLSSEAGPFLPIEIAMGISAVLGLAMLLAVRPGR